MTNRFEKALDPEFLAEWRAHQQRKRFAKQNAGRRTALQRRQYWAEITRKIQNRIPMP